MGDENQPCRRSAQAVKITPSAYAPASGYRDSPLAGENWFWLGCLIVSARTGTFGENRVWSDYTVLFPHAFTCLLCVC